MPEAQRIVISNTTPIIALSLIPKLDLFQDLYGEVLIPADLLSDLDHVEAEVISLAVEQHADLVIIDERMGRRHAQRLGLSVTGVLGVLLRAREKVNSRDKTTHHSIVSIQNPF